MKNRAGHVLAFCLCSSVVEQLTFNLWVPGSNPGAGTGGVKECFTHAFKGASFWRWSLILR